MKARGFTLIELAIVLVIITILIGGLAVPLSAQIQARRVAETNKTLDAAKEAIMGYAMANKTVGATPRPYLPCPDTNGDGRENRNASGECLQPRGFFPWVDLGVASADAWGNRLWYSVTDAFSDRSAGTGFSSASVGDLQVCSSSANTNTNDCGVPGNVAGNLPVILVSYGANGWGARNVNGSTLADPTSNDERENTNITTITTTDKEFVSRTHTKTDNPAGEFDDLLVWISADQLKGRICPAGGCP